MTFEQGVFYFLATVTVVSAVMMLLQRNPVNSALFLILNFFRFLNQNIGNLYIYMIFQMIKKKNGFEQYIPFAVSLLKNNIIRLNDDNIQKLAKLIQRI